MRTDVGPSFSPSETQGLRVLFQRNFALLWLGLFVVSLGSWLQNATQLTLASGISGSPAAQTLLLASFAVPMLLIPVFAGALADRTDRIAILKVAQVVAIISTAALAILTFTKAITLEELVALSAVSAIAAAVSGPANHALIADLVRRRDLLAAVAISTVISNLVTLVGPVVIGAIGLQPGSRASVSQIFQSFSLMFAVNAVAIIVMLGILYAIRPSERQPSAYGRGLLGSIVDGIRFVEDRSDLLLLLALLAVLAVFGRAFSQLVVNYAEQILLVQVPDLRRIIFVSNVASILTGVVLAAIGHRLNRAILLALAPIAVVVGAVGFSLSRSYTLSVALVSLSEIGATIFVAVALTALLSETKAPLRGRVMGLYTVASVGLGPLGTTITGNLKLPSLSLSMEIGLGVLVLGGLIMALFAKDWGEVGAGEE